MSVRNIIFDLGGIFIDIDYNKTRNAFIELGLVNFDEWYQQSYANPLFSQLEKGEIEEDEFADTIIKQANLNCGPQQVVEAWNAMLGAFRPASISYLKTLAGQYKIYLLSNTNAIHHRAFSERYSKENNGEHFDAHFRIAWYSHLLGHRKPDVACYQHVLDLENLKASETLFVDDTPKNLEGAKLAGLQTLWLKPPHQIEDELPVYLANAH